MKILGIPIDNLSLDEAVAATIQLIRERRFSFTVTPNVDHILKLQEDSHFRGLYDQADLIVPDGVPLIWASRILGTPLKGRVNGTDLMERLCAVAAERAYSVFLLGGTPGAAEGTSTVLKRRHPTLQIAGISCPSLGFDDDPHENAKVIETVASARPTILFVALGAPKQERWMAQHAATAGVKHAVGVGASFSFISGQMMRAPVWMQRGGLEWLWRLLLEPRRLGRRYLLDNPPFFWLIARDAWRARVHDL